MKTFLNLWMPIFLSNTILMLGGLFDTIFLSHFSAQHVTAMAVCLGIYSLVFVSGMGILQGMMQELAEANGRKAYPELQLIIKQSIIIVLCLSGGAAWLFTHAEPLLNVLRADEEIRALIQPCLVLMALTIPGHFLLRILFIYTQTCGQAKRVFYANTLYLIIKVTFAYGFIFGISVFNIPAYGVKGAFLAHLLAQWLLLVLYYFFFLEKKLSIHWLGEFFNLKILCNILSIGLPTAVVVFIDVFTISAIALLALPLGNVIVNAHQIAMGFCGLLFMLPLSLGATFSILVSTKIGEGCVQEVWHLTGIAMKVAFVVALSASIVVAVFHPYILPLFSNDKDVLNVVFSLVFLLCWMHIFDAMLVVSVNMLRCWKVIVFPMLVYSSMILVFGLGGGWYLAFHPVTWLGRTYVAFNIQGFWIMLCFAYTLAAIICFTCLKWKHSKYLKMVQI